MGLVISLKRNGNFVCPGILSVAEEVGSYQCDAEYQHCLVVCFLNKISLQIMNHQVSAATSQLPAFF